MVAEALNWKGDYLDGLWELCKVLHTRKLGTQISSSKEYVASKIGLYKNNGAVSGVGITS